MPALISQQARKRPANGKCEQRETSNNAPVVREYGDDLATAQSVNRIQIRKARAIQISGRGSWGTRTSRPDSAHRNLKEAASHGDHHGDRIGSRDVQPRQRHLAIRLGCLAPFLCAELRRDHRWLSALPSQFRQHVAKAWQKGRRRGSWRQSPGTQIP